MQGKLFLKLLGRLIMAMIFISEIAFCFLIASDFIGELQSRQATPPEEWPFFLFMMGVAAFVGLLGLLRIVRQRTQEPVIDHYVLYCLLGSFLIGFVGMLLNGPWR